MSVTMTGQAAPAGERFRLHRAGILNVWQYDDQVFTFGDGRLLLRGANGAGKSKTLEMLLPFVLDGDKSRITASAKHHTSLLWLMTDGYEGQARVGYVWVEFLRTGADGEQQAFTCGVGIRASASARTATSWHFATTRRIGHDLLLEDAAGPLTRPRLEEAIGVDGQVFEKAAPYKEHVGKALFGLEPAAYDDVLRLLYWLRQPQVGEDIDPGRLTQQLSQALPQLEDHVVRSAGDTFDELTAFGEQIDRRTVAAEALAGLASAYEQYARAVVGGRARAVVKALRDEGSARRHHRRAEEALAAITAECAQAEQARDDAVAGAEQDRARLDALQRSTEAGQQRELDMLDQAAEAARTQAAGFAEQLTGVEGAVRRRTDDVRSRAGSAEKRVSSHRLQVGQLALRLAQEAPGAVLPAVTVADPFTLYEAAQVEPTLATLDRSAESLGGARRAVSHRRAGVAVLRKAIEEAETEARNEKTADDRADEAEARWERARDDRLEAQSAAEAAGVALAAGLADWAARPESPGVEIPGELDESAVAGLGELARLSAAPQLSTLGDELQSAVTRREGARAEIGRLRDERVAVAAQTEPPPPAPHLPRTERSDGLALWQAIDFADEVTDEVRSKVEAALQAAGLLDAWVRPGGLLLGADHLDVVLAGPGQAERGGTTIAEVLRPDPPAGSAVTAEDVASILAGIGLGAGDASAWIGTDGTWRLGPAHGRADKERAQYIGATARAAERERRLAVLDAAIAEQSGILVEAQGTEERLGAAIAQLQAWVDAVPSADALRAAWTVLGERERAEGRAQEDNRKAQDDAHEARQAAARARAEVDRLAGEHGLPSDRGGLEAADERLAQLDQDLRDAARVDSIAQAVRHWADALGDLNREKEQLAAAQRRAEDSARNAATADAAHRELLAAVGDSVRELQAKVAALRGSIEAHDQDAEGAGHRLTDCLEKRGAAGRDLDYARQAVEQQGADRVDALNVLAAVSAVPGMLVAAGGHPEDPSVLTGLGALPASEPAPRSVRELADRLAALTDTDDATAATTRVWRAHGEAQSGPASDHQPTVAEFGDLLAVSGRDDAGEADVVSLSHRVAAGVERDRGLLTEREKHQFEQHVLGELGDAIRRCRRDAEELVDAMNKLLAEVTTSQGIRVSLRWDLREDVPAEARRAVQLLAQPVGALLPDEREALRDVLHRLIEASRSEHPDLSYSEHLAAALDYRTWSAFIIRYSRPEGRGAWERLHRKSPLSQGEQKVLCYLPLFAAAAAHFTSLAGAAPYAPRLVLLDDAFPKIDVRTHPLLFGLLVQLDLDFVITSERLWGDHDTVPSLAIYEALRDPLERGIAQYEYRWDGRALHAIG